MDGDTSTTSPATGPADSDAASQIVELSALTGGLAHEIRNSLSTLTVNLQLLDEDWQGVGARPSDDAELVREAHELTRRSRKRIATLLTEARRLETILSDFLQFVNRRELHTERADLNYVVAELADFFRPQAQAHGIELKLAMEGGPVHCPLDVNLLKQALLNLLINAQQAMEGGGTIEIRTRRDGEHGTIEIQDNGAGISPADLSRVFDAYYSTRKAGTGLGLPTTRRIVREHGGDVSVTSTPGRGTTFTIRLPLARAAGA